MAALDNRTNFFTAVFLTLVFSSLSQAQTECAAAKPGLRAGDVVAFHATSADSAAVLDGAIGEWERACGALAGNDLPRLEARVRAQDATYHVTLHRRNPSGPQCGWLRGRDLVVYRFATAEGGESLHCGDPVLVLAHEIGHALGLEDVDITRCRGSIMSTIDSANRYRRVVQPAECAEAAAGWLSTTEVARLGAAPVEERASQAAASEEPDSGAAVSAVERAAPARRK